MRVAAIQMSMAADTAASRIRRDDERVLLAEIDVETNRALRAAWGLFRDRRPELYGAPMTLDGARTSFDGANETPRR